MKRIAATNVIVFACAAVLLPAADTPSGFQTPAAQDAQAKFDAAKRKAKEQYDQAIKAATLQAIADFEKARKAVMQTGGTNQLAEANRIQGEIDQLKAGGGDASWFTGTTWLHVPAKATL